VDLTSAQSVPDIESRADLESIFAVHYGRVASAIAIVTGDRSLAEELAVEVFLRWSRRQGSTNVSPEGWLYRIAVNLAIDELRIDELRKRRRRDRLNKFFQGFRRQPTPEEIYSTNQERDRVREVLSRMNPRQAELLVLRTEGFSYDDLAGALRLNPSSVGTLLCRAQRTFRKEYIAKYGPQ
jgi:RNA polymerase sigma-70 factor, ECF subfamily